MDTYEATNVGLRSCLFMKFMPSGRVLGMKIALKGTGHKIGDILENIEMRVGLTTSWLSGGMHTQDGWVLLEGMEDV